MIRSLQNPPSAPGPRRTLIYTFFLAATLAVASAAAQQTSPVSRVSSERFVFSVDGSGDLVVPIDWSHDPGERDESVEHLVVMVHGYSRVNLYGELLTDMLAEIPGGETVAHYAPHFLTSPDIETHGFDERYPYWTEGGWAIGHNSRDDDLPRETRVSSFAVVDELVLRARGSFPNLRTVTIGGFSAGGQFTNRYLAGNRVHEILENDGIEVRYIVGAPSSYLYFCENRLISRDPVRFGSIAQTDYADCDNFNNYRFGFRNLNQYMSAAGPEALAANYAARRVDYITGADDDARASRALATNCGAMLQGDHRRDRMEIYMRYLEFQFGGDVRARHRMHVVPDVAHSTRPLFDNPTGQKILFEALLRDNGQQAGIPEGKSRFDATVRDWDIPVWTYRPAGAPNDLPILFVCHGTLRNGETYRDQWVDLADEHGFLVVVAEFGRDDFPGARGYNLGHLLDRSGQPNPADAWAFQVIEAVFDDIRHRLNSPREGYHLYGHSAGSQFAHRMVLFAAESRMERAVMANAGWYTMPDPSIAFPHGLQGSPFNRDILARRLSERHVVLLGTEDNDPNHRHLNTSDEANRQGPHRLARGQKFFETAEWAADHLDVDLGWELIRVPGVGHSNARMAPAAASLLFGEPN